MEGLDGWHLTEDIPDGQVVVVCLFLNHQSGRSLQSVLEYALVKHACRIKVHFVRVYFDLVYFRTVGGVCFGDEHVFGLRTRAIEL